MGAGPVSGCPGLPGCNPLIAPDPPTGGWQAWCRRCNWHGPVRDHLWQARHDKDQQLGADPLAPAPWIRGPGRK
jgi:hypothetical protein